MNICYLKMLLFIFVINILVLPHNENCQNNHYNRSLIPNNTQRTTIKSRLLAQTQRHNPHYHNDPELKEMIDKLNEEAIKKYQQTHEPYEQLKELVEKNGTKYRGGNDAEPMSTLEKELLETYQEVYGEENHIMLKSGMYPNDDEKSSSCECTDINYTDLTKRKGKDKYLKHLKHRCTRGICACSVGSFLLTFVGLALARDAALAQFTSAGATYSKCTLYVTILNMLDCQSMVAAIKAGGGVCSTGLTDFATPAASAAMGALYPWGIVALVLLILAVLLIILYIWLYRRRKRSLKHECKKHLCK
ncbi:stevor [Plasmodium reichenowi]|uniref:Stevor n=1 Tax=Plasmodium reichenowi TaxID=5854 RepID=A0A060RR01_PLARE|nr:stevor [Plasmodium reichenowi]